MKAPFPARLNTHFQAQAAFGTASTYLTSGVFLSGLAMLMGAGDVVVSYLSIIVNICGVLILFFAAVLERFRSRKKLTLALTALSRLATLLLAAIPALVPAGLRLAVFFPAVVVAFALQAQTTVVLNQWMLGFVEEGRRGRYISLRQTITLAVTVALSVTSGVWMDRMGGQYLGFVLIFGFAALMGAVELLLLARTPDGPVSPPPERRWRLGEMVRLPLQNRRFGGFVLYVGAFYLFLYIADSYTMVYLMRYLALPYGTVNGLYLIISLPQVALLGLWGRLSDRRGHGFVLHASIWLFVGETLFLSFSGSQNWQVVIPLSFLVSSVANAGFSVAVFNRRYELMPEENRIVYDNFYTAAVGLGFILGPMVGGLVKAVLEGLGATSFQAIRLLYLLSSGGILSLQVFTAIRTRCAPPTSAPAHPRR